MPSIVWTFSTAILLTLVMVMHPSLAFAENPRLPVSTVSSLLNVDTIPTLTSVDLTIRTGHSAAAATQQLPPGIKHRKVVIAVVVVAVVVGVIIYMFHNAEGRIDLH